MHRCASIYSYIIYDIGNCWNIYWNINYDIMGKHGQTLRYVLLPLCVLHCFCYFVQKNGVSIILIHFTF